MARGIERSVIFRDDRDREDFLNRLAALATDGALAVYAWALMPTHVHLFLRTGALPLSRAIGSLLAGYATFFNRRHQRVGHLFQNRFKSILCEEEPYFLQLVRYIHLNPVVAGILRLEDLERYPYTGHSSLAARKRRPWQGTQEVLERFSDCPAEARRLYRAFVAEGVGIQEGLDLDGGGLVRSRNAWRAVRTLRRGRERFASDERVLGSGAFVERILHEVDDSRPQPELEIEDVIDRVCVATGVSREALAVGARRAQVSEARQGIAYLWFERLGRSGGTLAAALGIRAESVWKAARRGARNRERWDPILDAQVPDTAGEFSTRQ